MKKAILSITIVAAFLITSCNGSNGADVSEAVETTTVVTTTTTEATITTEATTTTNANPISSFDELCDLGGKVLGSNQEASLAVVQNSFTKEFKLLSFKTLSEESRCSYSYEYQCNVLIEGYIFDSVTFFCDKDYSVIELDFYYHCTDKNELMDYYNFLNSKLTLKFNEPSYAMNDYEDDKFSTYEPGNGISYSALYFISNSNPEYDRVGMSFSL